MKYFVTGFILLAAMVLLDGCKPQQQGGEIDIPPQGLSAEELAGLIGEEDANQEVRFHIFHPGSYEGLCHAQLFAYNKATGKLRPRGVTKTNELCPKKYFLLDAEEFDCIYLDFNYQKPPRCL